MRKSFSFFDAFCARKKKKKNPENDAQLFYFSFFKNLENFSLSQERSRSTRTGRARWSSARGTRTRCGTPRPGSCSRTSGWRLCKKKRKKEKHEMKKKEKEKNSSSSPALFVFFFALFSLLSLARSVLSPKNGHIDLFFSCARDRVLARGAARGSEGRRRRRRSNNSRSRRSRDGNDDDGSDDDERKRPRNPARAAGGASRAGQGGPAAPAAGRRGVCAVVRRRREVAARKEKRKRKRKLGTTKGKV